MQKIYSIRIKNSWRFLLVILLFSIPDRAFALTTTPTYYTPNGGTFTGTPTYCQGAAASSVSFNYTECTGSGTGTNTGVACNVSWYYNTSGATGTLTGATLVSGPTAFTSAAGGGGTLFFTPLTTTAGVFNYFAYITWTTGNTCPSPFYSSLYTVTVNPSPLPISGATTICQGFTSTLSDVGGGGTWSSSNTGVATITSAGVVYAITSGSSVISFGLPCGAVTTTVSVIATASPVTGPDSVCMGSTITLSDATAGGTWSSSNTGVASVDASGIVTPGTPGNTLITYTANCGSATHSVTVSPVPSAIIGDTITCMGAVLSLSDADGGGNWSTSNTAIATVSSSGDVHGISGGIVDIIYAFPTGCASTHSVIINPPPAAIAGPSDVCLGLTISLSDPSPIGTWSSSNTNKATISVTGDVTGVQAGKTVISFSNSCGAAATHTVTVNPLPATISGSLFVCVSATDTLHDADTSGTWTGGPSGTGTIDPVTGVVTGVSGGDVVITYTLPTTCITITTVTVVPPLTAISGPSSVCAGVETALSIAATGGTWSSGNTLAVIDTTVVASGTSIAGVTGLSIGIARISYSIGSGCASVITFTVNPVAPVAGPDSLCFGSTAYLTDIVGVGTWASTYPGIVSIDTFTGKITGVTTGISGITYTTPDGCLITHTVSVIGFPPGITGTMKACPGTTTVLANATPGGIWSSHNNGVATVNPFSGTVYGVFADTTSINYTIKPGCTVSTLVTINPNPAPITGFVIACETTSDTLRDATPGGVWSTLTPSLATISSIGVVTVLSGGNAIIVYTLPATGCMITDTIFVRPAPVPVITYNWMTATFYTDTYYVRYQWHDSLQGLIRGATSPSLAALYTQYYYVTVTDTFGCIGSSAFYHFDASHLGVNNTVNALIKVYPNPANSIVYIQSPVKVRAVISGIDSKIFVEQDDAKEINISGLANGMYFISLYNDDKQVITVRKLVKQ